VDGPRIKSGGDKPRHDSREMDQYDRNALWQDSMWAGGACRRAGQKVGVAVPTLVFLESI